MSITIRISVIAALLIAVSNAVPQRNVETNHQLLDDDALSIVCSMLDKATLGSASRTSRSMKALITPGDMQRAVIKDASSNGEQICIALAELWAHYDVQPVSLNKQLTLRVLIERYKSAQIVSKEEREFLMQLLPDHGNEMVAIVLLRRLFRSFVESSDPMLAARNFNDLDDKNACQKAIEHQISLFSKFQFEEQPRAWYFDKKFFRAFKSYLELSSDGLLRDSFDGIPASIFDELMRDREDCDDFCNPGWGSLKYAELVLQLGADAFGDGPHNPPLHIACWQGSIDVVKELFRFTGSQQQLTRVLSSSNQNALHCLGQCEYLEVAAEIGRLILESSLDAKVMITAIDSSDRSPLYIAARNGNSNLISLYLDNLSNLDRDLFVELMNAAIFKDHIDIVRLLLPFGGEWMRDPELLKSMLKKAMFNIDIFRLLLSFGGEWMCDPALQHYISERAMQLLPEMHQEMITLIKEWSTFWRRS